jgi:Domain of unknown function (DUF4258)
LDDIQQGADLERYRGTGHLVLDGTLGGAPVHVVIPPYAQGRMKQRDIDESEVLETLALPRSSHGSGKTEGRFEAAGKTSRGHLRVVYEKPVARVVVVITTYLESD